MTATLHKAPVFREAGFELDGLRAAQRAFLAEASLPQSAGVPIYTRYGNPTVMSVEAELSKLEGASWSVLTSSGLSAIDVALSVFQSPDNAAPWLFLSELYGGTNAYIDQVLVRRRGIDCRRIYPDGETYHTDKIVAALEEHQPAVFFFEPVTNPLLICVDMAAVIKAARSVGTKVVIDNTFATSVLCKPLDLGADLVVHSATKYLGGHGDLTAGVVSGNDPDLASDARVYRKLTGCVLSPDDAGRLQSHLTSFSMRVTKQFGNAAAVADFLSKQDRVTTTRYPGLPGHETHATAQALCGNRGFGGVVTFELRGGEAACERFIASAAPDIRYVPTMGDADTILLHARSTFGDKYPDGMIRLSVGIEDVDATIAVLERALAASEG